MKRSMKGLSLLELLIALSVIAIVFLALASGQITSLKTTASSHDIAAAKTFANRQMEGVRKGIILGVLNASDQEVEWNKYYNADCPADYPGLCKGSIANSSGYTSRYEIGPENANKTVTDEGLVQIRMEINWNRGGQTGILNIVDYVSCAEILLSLCPSEDGDFIDPAP